MLGIREDIKENSIYKNNNNSNFSPWESYYKILGDFIDTNQLPEHQQFIGEGSNFGFFGDGVHADSENIHKYDLGDKKYKKIYIDEAKSILEHNFTNKNYSLFSNNCQVYIESIITLARSIAQENNDNLEYND